MIRKLVFPMLFICVITNAQSPKYLVIENRNKVKEIVIPEGEMVVVKSFKGEKIRGRMMVVTDKLIQVKNRAVPLTNVKSIGTKDKTVKHIASLVVTNGMNLFLAGLNDNLRNGWETMSTLHKASVPMLSAGIPMLLFIKKHRSKNWKYLGVVENPFF